MTLAVLICWINASLMFSFSVTADFVHKEFDQKYGNQPENTLFVLISNSRAGSSKFIEKLATDTDNKIHKYFCSVAVLKNQPVV